MTDFRALCAELHAAFNTYAVDEAHHDLLTRAKAALAQPELQRPCDEELTLTYARAVAAAVGGKRGPFNKEDAEAAQLAGLRAVLDRWGRDQQNKENLDA